MIAGKSAILVIFSTAWISCSVNKESSDGKKTPTPPKLVGVVMSKNSKSNYVLIEQYGSLRFEEGTDLTTGGEGRTAQLVTSGEKMGPYIAADIESGAVAVGDAVYFLEPVQEKSEDTPAELQHGPPNLSVNIENASNGKERTPEAP